MFQLYTHITRHNYTFIPVLNPSQLWICLGYKPVLNCLNNRYTCIFFKTCIQWKQTVLNVTLGKFRNVCVYVSITRHSSNGFRLAVNVVTHRYV
jgi:hypothetical protein